MCITIEAGPDMGMIQGGLLSFPEACHTKWKGGGRIDFLFSCSSFKCWLGGTHSISIPVWGSAFMIWRGKNRVGRIPSKEEP